MVNSIVKQSIEIRLKFENTPRLTASAEICVLCGMLCKIFELTIPSVKTTGELKDFVLSKVQGKDDRTEKLINLLSGTQKESEIIIDEWYEVIKYGYDNT